MRVGIDGRELYAEKRGIGQYVSELCRELDKCLPAAEFFVYSRTPVEMPVASDRWIARTDPSRWGRWLSPLLWLKVRAGRLARRDRLDVFWGTSVFLPPLPASVRTVSSVHDLCHVLTPETFDPLHLRGVRLFFDRDVRRADAVATISNGTRDRLRRHLGREADAVVLPGVSDSFRRPEPVEITRCRERWGLPEDYLLTVAAWEPRKNLECLARAFLDLREEGPLARHKLVLVGKPATRAMRGLRDLIDQDRGRGVMALGYVPDEDLPALYSGAAAFLLPSLYEGFGMPVLEARACGVRSVVTDTPELREAGGGGTIYIAPTREGIRRGILEALKSDPPRPERDTLPTWKEGALKLSRLLTGAGRKPFASFRRPMTTGIWIARGLALLGFADAAYLTATHYAGAPVFCGASGGCETVLTSDFATVGPVPVALVGTVYYAIASLAAWTPTGSWTRGTAAFLAGLTGLALVVSGVLFWLQASVIDAWCRFCLVSAMITVLLFATAVWLLSRIRHERPIHHASSLAG